MTSKRSGKQAAKSQATEKSEKGRDSLVVTEAEKKLSIAEKLELLENEFCLLRDMCLQSGYSGDQIQSAASPFLASIKKSQTKKIGPDEPFIVFFPSFWLTRFFPTTLSIDC